MTKPKTRKKYKFTCGHIGYGKLSWVQNGVEKRICAKCGARVESVIRKCVDCKKEFIGSKYGHAQVRCPNCQGLFRLAASTARNRIRAEASRQKKALKKALEKKAVLTLVPEAPPEINENIREDCMFLEHCLRFDLKKNCNACVGCGYYVNKRNARFHGGTVR